MAFRKFPGPSQSLPDITSPPSPVFISKKSLYENKSRKSTSPEFKANGLRKNSSPEFKANESQKRGDDVYRDAMEQVRHRQFPTIQNTPVRRDSSGDDDFVLPDLDEWLEDDLGMIKEKRKRERSSDEKKTDKQKVQLHRKYTVGKQHSSCPDHVKIGFLSKLNKINEGQRIFQSLPDIDWKMENSTQFKTKLEILH